MDLTVATFNLYGLNQGLSMLAELCQTCNIIFVQEHWLLPSDLERLAAVDCKFTSISSSAMENTIGRGVLRGRPFGGVAILVENRFMHCLNILAKLDRIIAIKVANCVFINVYFPVLNCVSYDDTMTELVVIIDGILSENLGCNIILGGDFNLEFINELSQRQIFNDFVRAARLRLCDSRVVGSTQYTYLSGAHNSTSFIDHFFVNVSLLDNVEASEVIDSGWCYTFLTAYQ